MESIKYVLCTAAGVAIGYYVAQGRMEREFHARLDREVDEARDFYRRKYTKKAAEEGEDPEFTEAAINAAEALRQSYQGITVAPSVLAQEMTATVQRAVDRGDLEVEERDEFPSISDSVLGDVGAAEKEFEEISRLTDPEIRETLLSKFESAGEEVLPIRVRGLVRDESKPPVVNYNRISTPDKTEAKAEADKAAESVEEEEIKIEAEFISKDTFINDEFGYKQFSFTYFAGDDILANEEDEPISGSLREDSIGTEAMTKLKVGREAMDGETTIYVRNKTGQWEFEITRSEGKFSDEVGAESG